MSALRWLEAGATGSFGAVVEPCNLVQKFPVPVVVALHYLAGIAALTSPEREAARATPWRDRLAVERWFRGEYRVLHRILA